MARERTQSVTVSYESYENKLYEILNDPKAQNDAIFDHIENNFTEAECQSKHFVRALMTSVCKSCIFEAKIDQELFKKRGLVLSKFIARKDSLELESLFAIQVLDNKLQHQPGSSSFVFFFRRNNHLF